MRDNTLSAGDAIKAFLKAHHLEDKVLEARIIIICKSMFGNMGKDALQKVVFHNGQLTLYIPSPALRQEVGYQKTMIIQEINKEIGRSVIKSISIR